MFPLNVALNLPDWYRLERETEKTIEKLISVKELDYYLRNPDSNIRRLAIIRLSRHKPRDCENVLRKILEDPCESNENKELAAWVLKSVAAKWKLDIFIDNRYLAKFTGHEKLEDIYKISMSQPEPSLKFGFTRDSLCSQLPAAEENTHPEGNTMIDSSFDVSLWLYRIRENMVSLWKDGLITVLKLVKKAVVLLLQLLFINLPRFALKSVKSAQTHKSSRPSRENVGSKNAGSSDKYGRSTGTAYNNPDLMPLMMKSRRSGAHRPSPLSTAAAEVKKTVFNVLYVLFYPLRLFLRYKLSLVFVLLALYIFVNFTNPGILLFREYTGKDFLQMQTKAVNDVKQFTTALWMDIKNLSGFEGFFAGEKEKKAVNTDQSSPSVVRYLVTASRGLNIREAPDPDSKKLGSSLAFGSIVVFLDQIKTDTSGSTWFYIKTEDGRSGWVSARYLEEVKEG